MSEDEQPWRTNETEERKNEDCGLKIILHTWYIFKDVLVPTHEITHCSKLTLRKSRESLILHTLPLSRGCVCDWCSSASPAETAAAHAIAAVRPVNV